MTEHPMRKWLAANSGNTYQNYIDGAWTSSASGRTYDLYESALPDRLIGRFADSNEVDADQAAIAADRAARAWSKTPGSVRSAILLKFADLLERNRDELAFALSAEQGKVLAESYGEVTRAAAEARFNAGEALRVDGRTLPSENGQVRCELVRFPIGAVAAIAPWNFPLVTPVRKIAPALAYGCTAVLKPASATPWTSVKIVELLEQAGVPKGVVNLVTGSGSRVGDPLVAHPLIAGISFTGSSKLGMRINGTAGARLARTQLELGGKNAAVVLDYSDLASAAGQIASAAFTCTGQRCTAISRVIVLEDKAEALIAELKRRMPEIRVGPAWAEGATMGPLIDRRQFETVAAYIEEGKREGATLAMGGMRVEVEADGEGGSQGYYLAPTLFTNVQPHMKIAVEEIFGPVLSVLTAKDAGEAFELANATEYGLAASVFTDRLQDAETAMDAIETGMIHINHGTASQAHMPFGGLKNSGFGAYSIGHSNQEFFTGLKAVYVKSR